MRSWRSTSSLTALLLGALLLALGAGCRSVQARAAADARDATAESIVGRWRGEAVEAPARAWWAGAAFDVAFSASGDVSFVASTFAGKPLEVRFEGDYDVVRGDRIAIEEKNMGGDWRVERPGADEIRLTRDELKLALRRVWGT